MTVSAVDRRAVTRDREDGRAGRSDIVIRSRSRTEMVGIEIGAVSVFAGLSEADVQAIGRSMTTTRYEKGQTILWPGDTADRSIVIIKGLVRVYRLSASGRQLTLDIFEPGAILGDTSLLGPYRIRETFAEAMTDGVICALPPDELLRLIEHYPILGLNIIGQYSTRLQQTERALESMAFRQVHQRLAHKLLELGRRFGVSTARGTLIQPGPTQQQLAEMIGATRETVAHALADFRRQGLLDAASRHVLILDAKRLTRIGAGD